MPTHFATKRYDGRLIHGAHSINSLEIRGVFNIQGPQPICEGGAPEWVADLMDRYPEIQDIAISSEKGGVVWSRISTNKSFHSDRNECICETVGNIGGKPKNYNICPAHSDK